MRTRCCSHCATRRRQRSARRSASRSRARRGTPVDLRNSISADLRARLEQWPAYRQLTGPDRFGRGAAAMSEPTKALTPRTITADKVVKSICPYCAVGCGQNVYVKDEQVVH